ncbi:MAG: glycine cleavage system protein R [Nitrosomonadales bacterium]|nr:glycine cleavage system protein R [Nitrosomonadales bacterium]
MNTETENNRLVITATGTDRHGLVERLTGKIADSGCNIEESRMAVLGGEYTQFMLLSGPWHALSKLETQLPAFADQIGLTIHCVRTRKQENMKASAPYSVELTALDRPGTVNELAAFFARQGINIEELQTSTYLAPHTGAPMLSVVMTVAIRSNIHIATLRGDFLDYCDDLNLDATFEPVRG